VSIIMQNNLLFFKLSRSSETRCVLLNHHPCQESTKSNWLWP